jgi:hypothetical protein
MCFDGLCTVYTVYVFKIFMMKNVGILPPKISLATAVLPQGGPLQNRARIKLATLITKMAVFWVAAPCRPVLTHRPDDGGSKDL